VRVAVLGALGKMGSAVSAAVDGASDLALVGRLDAGDDPMDAVDAGAQVLVDFSVPAVSTVVVPQLAALGVHTVVGTTGWTADDRGRLRAVLAAHPGVGCVIAPNFSVGAALLMAFAERAAPHYESVEVVELHHPDKVDAPSGTARATAVAVAAARASAGLPPSPDATVMEEPGARGAVVDGVHVHAVRLRGLLAHEEVLLGTVGETLTLRHDTHDRASFMPGVLLAVRAVATRPGLTEGLAPLLDLDLR